MEATTDQAAPKRVRRRIFKLIDSRFQLKYTGIIVLVGVAVSAILGYFIYWLTMENRDLLGIDAEILAHVDAQDSYYMYMLIGFVVVMAVFLFLWGILITHKVAGPIFIISRYLRELGEGKVPHTRPLRRGDELKGFFETFSGMVASMKAVNLAEAEILEKGVQAIKDKDESALEESVKVIEEMIARKKTWGDEPG
jgi:hypothetical protein